MGSRFLNRYKLRGEPPQPGLSADERKQVHVELILASDRQPLGGSWINLERSVRCDLRGALASGCDGDNLVVVPMHNQGRHGHPS